MRSPLITKNDLTAKCGEQYAPKKENAGRFVNAEI
jgi:hypothetical protein